MLVPVRISDIGKSDLLSTDQVVHGIATAMEEWAICQALVVMHGEKRGWERYVSAGGHVRFDEDGEPILYFEVDGRRRAARALRAEEASG